MAGFTRIIVPLDGSNESEQALPYVNSLATRLSIPVRLLHSVEPDSPAITQSLYSTRRWIEPASVREAKAIEYLNSTAAGLRGTGLDVDTTIPHRDPVGGIVEEAGKEPSSPTA